MQNTKFRAGPLAMVNTATNILNPGTTTGGVNCTASPWNNLYVLINQIEICDKSGGGGTFQLFIGATGGSAAGTEIAKNVSVAANGVYTLNYPGGLRLSTADFLTGLANANTTLTIVINGEIGVGT